MINGKRVIATIQIRLNSTRLPKKGLLPLAGKPVLERMIERHRRSKLTDEVVVATTTNPVDDAVAELCKKLQCKCFRGSEDDLVSRVVGAVESVGAKQTDIIVQGMADSPLVDWRFVDAIVTKLAEDDYDYASNEIEETFPVGLDVRAYTVAALKDSDKRGQEKVWREHAGYYIFKHPEIYKQVNWRAEGKYNWPTLRLTLDTPEDYNLIGAVYDELAPKNEDFGASDIIDFLKKRPDLVALNSEIKQFVPPIPEK